MVNTVNQCMLSQAEFDFIAKANALSALNEQLATVELGLNLSLIVSAVFVITASVTLVFAFMIRYRSKIGSNAILVLIIFMAAAMGFGIYSEFSKAQSLEAEIAGTNKALKTMDKPDTKLFDACSKPNAIVGLAPNRDEPDFESSFESKIILD